MKCLEALNYADPTPIQEQAIPVALEGRDIVGLAQTGTGKTAAFTLPTISRLAQDIPKSKKRQIRALIISPTRELAAQIHDTVKRFTTRVPLRSAIIVGGVSYHKQKHALQHGVDILVGTPGRLIDMIDQGVVDLSTVETIILDEADQMLDIGFLPAIRSIMEILPTERQTMLFSATMPKEIRKLTHEHLNDPFEISVIPKTKTADKVEQKVVTVEKPQKIEAICDVLNIHADEQAVVFTRTKHGADKVAKRLSVSDIRAAAIHGNKSHNQRERALQDFRKGKVRVLVATDIAARGIDVPGVGLVVNFDLPEVPEAYVHRIGRTARAGESGIAISLVSTEELGLLGDIQRLIKIDIPAEDLEGEPVELDVPSSSGAKRPYKRRGGGGGGGRRRPRGSDGNHRKGPSKPRNRADGDQGGDRRSEGKKPFRKRNNESSGEREGNRPFRKRNTEGSGEREGKRPFRERSNRSGDGEKKPFRKRNRNDAKGQKRGDGNANARHQQKDAKPKRRKRKANG